MKYQEVITFVCRAVYSIFVMKIANHNCEGLSTYTRQARRKDLSSLQNNPTRAHILNSDMYVKLLLTNSKVILAESQPGLLESSLEELRSKISMSFDSEPKYE